MGERRHVEVEVLPGERRENLVLEYPIEQGEIHDHAAVVQPAGDSDGALIIVPMSRRVGQRTEYLVVTSLAPIGPVEAVQGMEAHRPGERSRHR